MSKGARSCIAKGKSTMGDRRVSERKHRSNERFLNHVVVQDVADERASDKESVSRRVGRLSDEKGIERSEVRCRIRGAKPAVACKA